MLISEIDAKLIDSMVEALKERGTDWIYPQVDRAEGTGYDPEWHSDTEGTCKYAKPNGAPACIVGLAASKAGIPLPGHGLPPNTDDAGGFLDERAPGVSASVRSFYIEAQGYQDDGETWGKSICNARTVLSSRQSEYLDESLAKHGVTLP